MSAGAWILEYIVLTWWFWPCLLVPIAIAFFVGTGDYGDPVEGFMVASIGVLISAAVVWPTGNALWNLVLPHYDETSKHELLVLHDQNSISGSFVLGSGQVDGVAAFSFYTMGAGYNQFVVLKAPRARVYQDLQPGETPWLVTFDGCKLWGQIGTCFNNGTVINEIHVPPNTIKPTLELDAK